MTDGQRARTSSVYPNGLYATNGGLRPLILVVV